MAEKEYVAGGGDASSTDGTLIRLDLEKQSDEKLDEKTREGARSSSDAPDVEAENVDVRPSRETRCLLALADTRLQFAIERIETVASRTASVKSKVSKIFSFASSKKKKRDRLPPAILPLSDLDNGVVGWESQDDPDMPLNFSSTRKFTIVGFLSAITFMTPFASSILAPAIEFLNEEFGNADLTVGSFPVSIYLLGYSVGPLFLSPLSEIYGRHVVLVAANITFCAWMIGCALAPTLDTLIVFRFFAGVGGSGCLTIGGGIISDMIAIDRRAVAITAWMIGPLLGPTIGPICGAFISQTIGWRWTSWITLIPGAIATLALAVLSSETNHRVLMQRKVTRLRRELGRDDLRSCYEEPEKANQTRQAILLNGLVRPIKMLVLSPLIFSLSLYVAFAAGVLYLLFNTIPMVFRGAYGWSLGITGLVYIALGVGYIGGMVCFTLLSDKTVVRMTMANDGVYEPEMRLRDCIWFALLLPVTFFWYGWSAHFQTHWIVPVLGLVPFGVGIVGIWQPIQAYIIDAYPQFAASGLAAFTVLRSVLAAFLPLAGPAMYDSLGLGWGNSLLGFIAIGLIPVPLLIYRYGGRLRKWQKLEL